jgi:rhodanese-related sulfurtransferase
MKTSFLLFCLALTGLCFGQTSVKIQPVRPVLGSPLVSFSQFETLADSVEHYRENRLISAQDFVTFSEEKNTIILDTRSKKFFDQKHVKGAINLPFADFTQDNLEALIPDKNTRILIYCNNNFMATLLTMDQRFAADISSFISDPSFASKQSNDIYIPDSVFLKNLQMQQQQLDKIQIKRTGNASGTKIVTGLLPDNNLISKNYTLALNIPTFINLYGYGYRNIYELRDMVVTSNSTYLQFEGTEVKPSDMESSFYIPEPSTLVNYSDLQELVDLVKPHREQRLVALDEFNQMKLDENTIILDARSKEMYDAKHVKGAIHLEFSEFTQETLDALTGGNRTKRILIYCNNNFITDEQQMLQDRYFMSKAARTPPPFMSELTLALNIPTYINLYGYGYQNVYELNELVVTSDPRIEFEGTSIK